MNGFYSFPREEKKIFTFQSEEIGKQNSIDSFDQTNRLKIEIVVQTISVVVHKTVPFVGQGNVDVLDQFEQETFEYLFLMTLELAHKKTKEVKYFFQFYFTLSLLELSSLDRLEFRSLLDY